MDASSTFTCIKAEPGLMEKSWWELSWEIAEDAPVWGPEPAEGEWGWSCPEGWLTWNLPAPTWFVDDVIVDLEACALSSTDN